MESVSLPYVSSAELLDAITIPRVDRCPALILILAPCRTGSSALLNAFACAGYESYFQPFKRALRNLMLGRKSRIEFQTSRRPIIVKEAFGPLCNAETDYDPVALLLRKGFPKDRIKIITMLRDPARVYQSWHRCFRLPPYFPEINPTVYRKAFTWTHYLDGLYRALGIEVFSYIDDLGRYWPVEKMMRRLFAVLSLPYSDSAIDWRDKPSFGSSQSLVLRDPEPHFFRARGVLDQLKDSTRYKYCLPGDTTLTVDQEQQLRKAGLYRIYWRHYKRCLSDLRLGRELQSLVTQASTSWQAGSPLSLNLHSERD